MHILPYYLNKNRIAECAYAYICLITSPIPHPKNTHPFNRICISSLNSLSPCMYGFYFFVVGIGWSRWLVFIIIVLRMARLLLYTDVGNGLHPQSVFYLYGNGAIYLFIGWYDIARLLLLSDGDGVHLCNVTTQHSSEYWVGSKDNGNQPVTAYVRGEASCGERHLFINLLLYMCIKRPRRHPIICTLSDVASYLSPRLSFGLT